MNCPYCKQQTSIWYRGWKCIKCPITVTFHTKGFSNSDKYTINRTVFYIDDYVKVACPRTIEIDHETNTTQLQRTDQVDDTTPILKINYIPQDISPSTAKAIWDRLTNLMVFS